MGKKADAVPRPPNRRKVRIVVIGPRTTEPEHLISIFCGQGYVPRPIGVDINIHSVGIDEEIVRLQVWDKSVEVIRLRIISSALFSSPRVGLMVLYDVRDEHSFERAKELITIDLQNKVVAPPPLSLSLSLSY